MKNFRNLAVVTAAVFAVGFFSGCSLETDAGGHLDLDVNYILQSLGANSSADYDFDAAPGGGSHSILVLETGGGSDFFIDSSDMTTFCATADADSYGCYTDSLVSGANYGFTLQEVGGIDHTFTIFVQSP